MRLDVTTLRGAAWAIEQGWHVDREDVGMSHVLDLCCLCAHRNDLESVAYVAHPPYEDDQYFCCDCGAQLEYDDD